MIYPQVKYKLINNDTKQSIELTHDPENWDNSERTLKREKTFGMMTELSKKLEFVKEGADFLRQADAFKGGEADVTLEETRYHPKTSHPYLHSTGEHDFSEYKSDELKVKVPFKSGGLNALIKSQLKEKFELERLESINGNEIDPIEKHTVALTSREVFLVSQLNCVNEETNILSAVQYSGNQSHRSPVPLSVVSNSDKENIVEPLSINSTIIESTTGVSGSVSEMLYLKADRDHRNVRFKINLSFRISDKTLTGGVAVINEVLHVRLKRYNNGDSFDFVENIDTYITINDVLSKKGRGYSVSSNQTISISKDESLALDFEMQADYATGLLNIYIEDINCSVEISEDSEFEDSQTLAIFFKDIGEKLMQIITGEKGRFYSDFLTNDNFSKLALTTGFWIRQFYTKTEIIDNEETEVDQNMTISLDEFLKTLNTVCNTGHHIEIINGVETLVVEDLKYYFQHGTAIFLNEEVSDWEDENAKEYCHSSLEFGYKKGGEYEEAMGLDEYNIKTGFTTPLKRVETKYSKVSPSRADTYGKEFARRKLKRDYPTTDTSYDKDKFILDLKEGLGLVYEERIWSDDFEELPKGVYSPETATNLRLTPSQIEKRHEWIYGTGVLKHQDDKIRYSNTEGNNGLITKEAGKPERKEKDDIEISNLEKALFEPKWVKFKHPLNYDIVQQLNGKTEVNGRLIPNVYFKVQYIYQGKKNYGYLFQQTQKQPNLGEFKLLKAV